jgi:hypothetical protein
MKIGSLRKKILLAFAIAAMLPFGTTVKAQALSCTLADIMVPGAKLQVGDLIFSDFMYSGTSGNNNSYAIPAGSIDVTPVTRGYLGIEFSSGWGVSGTGTFQDSVIQYDVSVAGGRAISDVHLWFDGDSYNRGLATVTKTVTKMSGDSEIAKLKVYSLYDGNNDSQTKCLNCPSGSIHVSEDIMVSGDGCGGSAWTSSVINTYSQVPIPGAFMLLGPGLAALAAIRKRPLGRNALADPTGPVAPA